MHYAFQQDGGQVILFVALQFKIRLACILDAQLEHLCRQVIYLGQYLLYIRIQ